MLTWRVECSDLSQHFRSPRELRLGKGLVSFGLTTYGAMGQRALCWSAPIMDSPTTTASTLRTLECSVQVSSYCLFFLMHHHIIINDNSKYDISPKSVTCI